MDIDSVLWLVHAEQAKEISAVALKTLFNIMLVLAFKFKPKLGAMQWMDHIPVQ